jgi:hypothetical protein
LNHRTRLVPNPAAELDNSVVGNVHAVMKVASSPDLKVIAAAKSVTPALRASRVRDGTPAPLGSSGDSRRNPLRAPWQAVQVVVLLII